MPSFDIVKKLDVKKHTALRVYFPILTWTKARAMFTLKAKLKYPKTGTWALFTAQAVLEKLPSLKELFPDAVVDGFSWGGGGRF